MNSLRFVWTATKSVRFATLGRWRLPDVKNEQLLTYAPGSPERAKLKEALKRVKETKWEIPCIVGGKEVRTGKIGTQVMPDEHRHVLCTYHIADAGVLEQAVQASLKAKETWYNTPFHDRAAVFLKAADLLSTKYRAELCAAVMLGQGKNVWQAEIDAGAETIDFWRFNCRFAWDIYAEQPPEHSPGCWNRLEYRPLEGFVLAVAPFNFLAIASNLASSPALMGNVVLMKPSSNAILASYMILKILEEAGLPQGVINFVPSPGSVVGRMILPHPDLAGVHFTGSTDTFAEVWQTISSNLRPYRSYPRVVGETGGKNFHFAHSSADVTNLVYSTIRAAFEYQGQKCSACARLYCPSDLWPQVKQLLLEQLATVKVGHCEDFTNFVNAVIGRSSFDDISKFIEWGKQSPECELLFGGKCDDSTGFFITPTVFLSKNPTNKLMTEEIFGPVLTIYVYDPKDYEHTLRLCDQTSKYALTGSIFARDRNAISVASECLRYSAGNFYINDKSTGAVVGQQPFGGGRASGTNDKSGSPINLHRWVSIRTVKESFLPLAHYGYPFMSSQ